MKRYSKLLVSGAIMVLLAWTSMSVAVEPPNIKRSKLRVNASGYMYKPLVTNGAASSATTWTLDSAQTDTSEAYQIVPGCYAAVYLKVPATTDTVDVLYIYGSVTGNVADWFLLDSLLATNGEDLGRMNARYIHGTANGTVGSVLYPVMARYLHFTATNHDGANAAAAYALTGYLITSPVAD